MWLHCIFVADECMLPVLPMSHAKAGWWYWFDYWTNKQNLQTGLAKTTTTNNEFGEEQIKRYSRYIREESRTIQREKEKKHQIESIKKSLTYIKCDGR